MEYKICKNVLGEISQTLPPFKWLKQSNSSKIQNTGFSNACVFKIVRLLVTYMYNTNSAVWPFWLAVGYFKAKVTLLVRGAIEARSSECFLLGVLSLCLPFMQILKGLWTGCTSFLTVWSFIVTMSLVSIMTLRSPSRQVRARQTLRILQTPVVNCKWQRNFRIHKSHWTLVSLIQNWFC